MSRYVFLGTVLPPLHVGSEPSLTFDELMTFFRDNLSKGDLEKVKTVLRYSDLKNVQNLLLERPLDYRANLNEKELDEALLNQVSLPPLLFDFLEEYTEVSDQLKHFSKVFITFFKEMDKKEKGFLKEYFQFEREWRILLAGYRAKKMGIDPTKELQHEDFSDPLVAEVIAQKDAPSFEFPFEFIELGEKLKDAKNPEEHYHLMGEFRFRRVLEMGEDEPFSIDYLLGYLVRLMIVEDVFALSEKKGNEHLNEMVKGSL
ncbi:MAG: DUF2764 family protein [Chlamydiia bacterium]|nr:DUF2764 family protein [Chlamydiia bacterium]